MTGRMMHTAGCSRVLDLNQGRLEEIIYQPRIVVCDKNSHGDATVLELWCYDERPGRAQSDV